jgi:hypothetical protein
VTDVVRTLAYGVLPMQRLRPLSEQECYLRCYGWVGTDDDVHVVHSSDREVEANAVMTERIRRAFEARLVDADADAA